MTLISHRNKIAERRKRFLFLGVLGAGVFLSFSTSLWLGLPLTVLGGYLAVGWFQYRARNGMRF